MARNLRQRDRVNYFPKQQLYNVVMEPIVNRRAGSRKRSKSVDQIQRQQQQTTARRSRSIEPRMPAQRENQPQMPARRANRATSFDQPRMPARRVNRAKSVDGRRVDNRRADESDTLALLAEAHAMLTMEVLKMKDVLFEKDRQIDMLTRQGMANKKLIKSMAKYSDEQNVKLDRLQNQLEDALNRLAMKTDDSHDGHHSQFDTTTSFSANDTTNESTFGFGVKFNASTSSTANDTINDANSGIGLQSIGSPSSTVNSTINYGNGGFSVVGDPLKSDTGASTPAGETTDGSGNGFGVENGAIADGGGTFEAVAEVHHRPMNWDDSSEPEYFDVEWLEESFKTLAD